MLTHAGHTVIAASSAEEAEELLVDLGNTVEVVLTDVVLPGRSGFQLARQVRREFPSVRILFMSGYLDDQQPDDGEFDTATDLLLKPFPSGVLLQRIAALLPPVEAA